jgi:hypothetical protein
MDNLRSVSLRHSAVCSGVARSGWRSADRGALPRLRGRGKQGNTVRYAHRLPRSILRCWLFVRKDAVLQLDWPMLHGSDRVGLASEAALHGFALLPNGRVRE